MVVVASAEGGGALAEVGAAEGIGGAFGGEEATAPVCMYVCVFVFVCVRETGREEMEQVKRMRGKRERGVLLLFTSRGHKVKGGGLATYTDIDTYVCSPAAAAEPRKPTAVAVTATRKMRMMLAGPLRSVWWSLELEVLLGVLFRVRVC